MIALLVGGFQRCNSQTAPPPVASSTSYPQRLATLAAHRETLAARYRQAGRR